MRMWAHKLEISELVLVERYLKWEKGLREEYHLMVEKEGEGSKAVAYGGGVKSPEKPEERDVKDQMDFESRGGSGVVEH